MAKPAPKTPLPEQQMDKVAMTKFCEFPNGWQVPKGFSGCWGRAEGKEKALASNLLLLQTLPHCSGGFCNPSALGEYLIACFRAEKFRLNPACTLAAAEARVIRFSF